MLLTLWSWPSDDHSQRPLGFVRAAIVVSIS
jgi:hypothetical protein